MKRFLIRLMALAVFALLAAASVEAQARKLNVEPFLKEDFADDPAVTMVAMSGRQSEWKGLDTYRSVSISGDDAKADALARAVRKDGADADFKETTFKQGALYFGFYGLGGEGAHRKYLFFLDLRPKGKDKTTLIYIEGDWTPEQVKKLIMEGR